VARLVCLRRVALQAHEQRIQERIQERR